VLPPGGEGKIKVTLHPKGTQTNIEKRIMVHTNDPEQAQFPLIMRGKLLIDVVAQPPFVHIRDLAVGKGGTGTFELSIAENSKAEIQSVELEDPEQFSLKKIDVQSDADVAYEVRFRGTKKVGTTTTRVVVKTTGENTPELFVPIRANTALNLRYLKKVRFARKNGKVQERTYRISARHGDAPKIKKVKDPDGLLEIEVLEPDGAMASIRLKVREDRLSEADGGGKHPLTIITNDRQEPRLEIEYTVLPASRENTGLKRGKTGD
jgi:hypothetical protein